VLDELLIGNVYVQDHSIFFPRAGQDLIQSLCLGMVLGKPSSIHPALTSSLAASISTSFSVFDLRFI
jgi:hypothetical protein